ncbi:transposase [Aminobacter sp. BE322]
MMSVKRYELSEVQWRRIAALLPGKAGDPGRTGSDNRLFVNGVLWVLRSGAHWHDLPERYGKWKTLHKRFSRWSKAKVWERSTTSPRGVVTLSENDCADPVMLNSREFPSRDVPLRHRLQAVNVDGESRAF